MQTNPGQTLRQVVKNAPWIRIALSIAVALDVGVLGLAPLYADCGTPSCAEADGFVTWDGSAPLPEPCLQPSPSSCTNALAYSSLGGACTKHATMTTVASQCNTGAIDCSDQSVFGVYVCSPTGSCVNDTTIARAFCASGTPPCGVAGSWNEYMDAYGGSCD